MTIGGYAMNAGPGYVRVQQHESGWSFDLHGNDADEFTDRWEAWEDRDFSAFLRHYDYHELLQ